MTLLGLLEAWLDAFLRPPPPAAVRPESRTNGDPPMSLTSTFVVTPAPPPEVAQQLVTFTVNGGLGGVVDALKKETFVAPPGATVKATAVNVSAGGVASDASQEFTFVLVDNTTKPPAPTGLAIASAPTPDPAPPAAG